MLVVLSDWYWCGGVYDGSGFCGCDDLVDVF